MKHYSKIVFWMFCCIALLTSCSIEKRKYVDGYHVEWRHRNSNHAEIQKKDIAQADSIIVDETHLAFSEINNDSLSKARHPLGSDISNKPVDELNEAEISISESSEENVSSLNRNKLKDIFRHGVSGGISQTLSIGSESAPTPIHDLNKVGLTFSTIGLIFAVLALTFLMIGIFVAVDWAALGYVILAIMAAGLAGFFAWIAQGIFWHHKQGIPAMQWPGLILGLLGLYALIRIIFKV